jgi:hypothetical protein
VLRTTSVALGLGLAFTIAIAPLGAARANPAGEVPGAGHVRLEANYDFEHDSARIAREQVGNPAADPLAPLPREREFAFQQDRHTVTPSAELGIGGGVWLSFAVPVILSQSSQLDLADGVARTDSTTFTGGILTGNGFDARDPTTPPGGTLALRGVVRSGIPEVRGGIGVAPMNQALDPSKPTWKLGVEGRFAVGRVMRFDAVDPAPQTGVSTGVHELRVWTSVDRRFDYFEGWFEASYQRPIATRAASLFKDPGFGATNLEPGQTAGASFGLEAYLVNDAQTGNRVSLDLGTRINAHFEGRDYTELWEVFALAGDRRTAGPLVLDGDPTAPGEQPLSHPGITNRESYLETAARVAVRARLGRHVSFAAVGELVWKTDHVISFADAGVDLPTCPTGTPRCEIDDNDLVNADTQEVNPLHARQIDLVGHRYRSEHNRGLVLGVEAQLQF